MGAPLPIIIRTMKGRSNHSSGLAVNLPAAQSGDGSPQSESIRVSPGGDDFDGEAFEVTGFGDGDEHRVVGALAVSG